MKVICFNGKPASPVSFPSADYIIFPYNSKRIRNVTHVRTWPPYFPQSRHHMLDAVITEVTCRYVVLRTVAVLLIRPSYIARYKNVYPRLRYTQPWISAHTHFLSHVIPFKLPNVHKKLSTLQALLSLSITETNSCGTVFEDILSNLISSPPLLSFSFLTSFFLSFFLPRYSSHTGISEEHLTVWPCSCLSAWVNSHCWNRLLRNNCFNYRYSLSGNNRIEMFTLLRKNGT